MAGKTRTKKAAPADRALVEAVAWVLYELCGLLEEQIEESHGSDDFLMAMGSICESDIPSETSGGRGRLTALASDLREVLEPQVVASSAPALFEELLYENNALAWRLSPFRTLPVDLHAGLPTEAEYNDLVPLATTVCNLALFLNKQRALPAALARRAKNAPRWADAAVTLNEGNGNAEFDDLCEWSKDPTVAWVAATPPAAPVESEDDGIETS